MKAHIADELIALNRRFYQSLAAPFAETRGRLQPGVLRLLEDIPKQACVLDLGCGNGELAAELEQRGHQGAYLGVDFSAELLAIARERNYDNSKARFVPADLTRRDWAAQLGERDFDYVLAFATLHHIPGEALRLALLKQVRELLAQDGRFIHSNWQFLNSERLLARVQDWAAAGLSAKDVDAGDYLLDWRREGQGLRYVHHFSAEELAGLAAASGFAVLETFSSDGETGDLGLYGVWRIAV